MILTNFNNYHFQIGHYNRQTQMDLNYNITNINNNIDDEIESNNLCVEITIINKIILNDLKFYKKLGELKNMDIRDIINFYKDDEKIFEIDDIFLYLFNYKKNND